MKMSKDQFRLVLEIIGHVLHALLIGVILLEISVMLASRSGHTSAAAMTLVMTFATP